jgi:hypothetical protein
MEEDAQRAGGKLAKLMFKKNSGNYEVGVKLAGVTWGLATVTPIFGIVAVLIIKFELMSLILLVSFILLTPINFVIHREACVKCRMRDLCPDSIAKKS